MGVGRLRLCVFALLCLAAQALPALAEVQASPSPLERCWQAGKPSDPRGRTRVLSVALSSRWIRPILTTLESSISITRGVMPVGGCISLPI
jgi:hypothetical protein